MKCTKGDGGFLASCIAVADTVVNMAKVNVGEAKALACRFDQLPEWQYLSTYVDASLPGMREKALQKLLTEVYPARPVRAALNPFASTIGSLLPFLVSGSVIISCTTSRLPWA